MTLFEEAIIGGLIGEAISRCTDISWTKIKEMVINKNDQHKNIESQIYCVIVNALNEITCHKFAYKQEMIFQAAEKLLAGYKKLEYNCIEVVRSGLQILGECVDDDKYTEFNILLYRELGRSDNEELYRQIRLLQYDKESKKTSSIEWKVDNLEDGIKEANEKLDSIQKNYVQIPLDNDINIRFRNNKKQKYIDNWNSRLFLHMDNDENPVTLADAFIMPDYTLYKNGYQIEFWLEDKLHKVIDGVIHSKKSTNLLIQGAPGMGKSSIVSWIANQYRENDNIIILRFRSWENEDLKNGLLKAVIYTLECKKADLENNILVLDGFDEIKSVSNRNTLLNDFWNDILDYDNIKIIITSRFEYIDEKGFQSIVNLKPFDIMRICRFYHIITNGTLEGYKINDTSIIGIPVILYMAIMSDISITEDATRPDLYNRIFAEKGGIFDRFSYKGEGYDGGAHPLRNKKNIISYLDFLRKTAFEMFERNNLSIERKEGRIPRLDFQGSNISVLEFPIKHLFEKTDLSIEFIHKSIYEYFVAEYIFEVLDKSINGFRVDFADALGSMFKRNRLSGEIRDYLRYRFQTKDDLCGKYDRIYETFQLMMQDGMTFHINGRCTNSMECEMNIFANMLDVLHLWGKINLELDDMLCKYIQYNKREDLNLTYVSTGEDHSADTDLNGVYLAGADISYSDLHGVNLCGSNLRRARFINSRLSNVNLSRADLSQATFKGVILSEVEFEYTELTEAIFEDVDFRGVDLTKMRITDANLAGGLFCEEQISYLKEQKCALFEARVYRKGSDDIISYKKYSWEKKKEDLYRLLRTDQS